jgi:hypothetical protein
MALIMPTDPLVTTQEAESRLAETISENVAESPSQPTPKAPAPCSPMPSSEPLSSASVSHDEPRGNERKEDDKIQSLAENGPKATESLSTQRPVRKSTLIAKPEQTSTTAWDIWARIRHSIMIFWRSLWRNFGK